MAIVVKCFASLREQLGVSEKSLDCVGGQTISDVWYAITSDPPPGNLLCACNLEYVDFDHLVKDGDEVAFFPPVTGG
ncbi:MAG: MoaD/ThiS family protein [Pseudomonadota bacterium]